MIDPHVQISPNTEHEVVFLRDAMGTRPSLRQGRAAVTTNLSNQLCERAHQNAQYAMLDVGRSVKYIQPAGIGDRQESDQFRADWNKDYLVEHRCCAFHSSQRNRERSDERWDWKTNRDSAMCITKFTP